MSFLNHTTTFHFYLLFSLSLFPPYLEYSFPQVFMFPFLYNIMRLFICISSCLHAFLYYTSVSDAFCISFTFSSSYILAFHYDFSISSCLLLFTSDFQRIYFSHVCCYISPFIFSSPLHLIAFLFLIGYIPFCSTMGFFGISHIHLLFHIVLNLLASHHVSFSVACYESFLTPHCRSGCHIS